MGCSRICQQFAVTAVAVAKGHLREKGTHRAGGEGPSDEGLSEFNSRVEAFPESHGKPMNDSGRYPIGILANLPWKRL